MARFQEPDGVDFTIGEVKPGPNAREETLRAIEAYKQRPTYPAESEEAERILARLGIHHESSGKQKAEALLEHWRKCIAELGDSAAGQPDLDQPCEERIDISLAIPPVRK